MNACSDTRANLKAPLTKDLAIILQPDFVLVSDCDSVGGTLEVRNPRYLLHQGFLCSYFYCHISGIARIAGIAGILLLILQTMLTEFSLTQYKVLSVCHT